LAKSPFAEIWKGAEHAHVEVSAAHHRERVRVVEVRRPRQLGYQDLAGVRQVRVDLVVLGRGAFVEHAVLGVQHHSGALGQVVGDQIGLADPDVHIRPVRDVPRYQGGHVVLRQTHTATTRST